MDLTDIETWQAALADETLLCAAAATDSTEVSAVTALRKRWSAPLVAAAIELTGARRRSEGRVPDPARLVADRTGLEQATSFDVATWKAQRFRDHGAPTLDLCCGIGGDLMALAPVVPVTGIDHAPLRAWMAGINADCPVRCADVLEVDRSGHLIHLDPSRRDERTGARRHAIDDAEPGRAFITEVTGDLGAAIKLGPGIDPTTVPDPDATELEFISRAGRLVQAVLWCGELVHTPGGRTATSLPGGVTLSGMPAPPPVVDGLDAMLHVPDPAIERAGLLGIVADDLDAGEPAPGLGLLTGPAGRKSPWMKSFDVVAVMPWRQARVRKWLADHDGGIVTVRTRGKAVDPDIEQRVLRGRGTTEFTLFVLRLGRRIVAVVTLPAATTSLASPAPQEPPAARG